MLKKINDMKIQLKTKIDENYIQPSMFYHKIIK